MLRHVNETNGDEKKESWRYTLGNKRINKGVSSVRERDEFGRAALSSVVRIRCEVAHGCANMEDTAFLQQAN